jgi:hypothetical protein
MLAWLVSERWTKGTVGKRINISRAGPRFAFVLDYLRYKQVVLPATVSKEMFLKDLDYYGITVPKEGSCVKEELPKAHANHAIRFNAVRHMFT